jgi:enoyl-CoA hydratase/carnithine racemase
MASSYTTILYDDERPPVARLTLNRPDKRNPLSPATAGELVHALRRARDDAAIRVVILTGAGSVFSAGGDLSLMSGSGVGDTSSLAQPASLVELFSTIHGLGLPIIAMVNGHALAGGLGLMVACDLVIASDQATFGTTEIKVGLWPMMITAELVRNIGRKRALDLMLTARRITAQEALDIGLINQICSPEKLEEETVRLAETIASYSPATIALGLRAFYASQDLAHEPALRFLEQELGNVLALEDAREGLAAFIQKRPPVWKGR